MPSIPNDFNNVDVRVIKSTYSFLKDTKIRKKLLVGGAGSGKSWAIAQYLLFEKFYKEDNIRILVCRKTLPSLRKSCYRLLQDMMRQYKLPFNLNKTEMIISHKEKNNSFWFSSLDDIEKIKSIEGINYIWVEEATEIMLNEFMQLCLRARALNCNPDVINEIITSFNPIDPRSFLRPLTVKPDDDMAVHHSTFRDNPFLDPEYVRELETLIKHDLSYHKIYNLGEWATSGNLIYNNWDVVKRMPPDSWFDRVGYGLDFGYNCPAALIKMGVKEDQVWEQELMYEKKLTNTDIIAQMKVLIPPHCTNHEIRADSAEPDRIEEIYQAGFNVHPCEKGKGSIKLGIDRVKRFKIHVMHDSTNLIEEKQGYKWKEDKYGEVLDEPVGYNDHLMDAERYFLGTKPLEGSNIIVLGEYGVGVA